MCIGEILSIQWMAFRFFSLVSSVQFDAQVWADAARRLPLPPGHHCKIQGWNFQEKDTGRVWSYKTDSLLHWSMCYKVSTRTYEPVSILLETMRIVCWGPHYRTLAGWKNIGQPWNASRLLDMTEIYNYSAAFCNWFPSFPQYFETSWLRWTQMSFKSAKKLAIISLVSAHFMLLDWFTASCNILNELKESKTGARILLDLLWGFGHLYHCHALRHFECLAEHRQDDPWWQGEGSMYNAKGDLMASSKQTAIVRQDQHHMPK